MDNTETKFDAASLEAMNEQAIRNQFFTPDEVYIELGLMKDIPIGVVYADQMLNGAGPEAFGQVQAHILSQVKAYQKRDYDTVVPFFSKLGYDDAKIEAKLAEITNHDVIFAMAPATKFFETLIRHTIRNQNNSRPAGKYTKKMLDDDQYIVEAIPVTYHFNTYPLTLSHGLMISLAEELGESLGVNIKFLNKHPTTFDETDWSTWMAKINCYYFDNIGRFTRGEFSLKRQEALDFVGCYFFSRKRFEREVMAAMHGVDFLTEIQNFSARFSLFCDFEWLQNNEVRLTEETEHVPVDSPDLI